MLTCTISQLELGSWTPVTGPTINPITANGFAAVNLPDGLSLYCCGPAYSGWLAHRIDPLVSEFANVQFSYAVTPDEATNVCAQVIEADFKITDSAGWTYDGSGQWNIAEGWEYQVGNPWVDTGVKVNPFSGPTAVIVRAIIDYAAHTLTFKSVSANAQTSKLSAVIPAQQIGWQPSTIVTQLQQCINGNPGAYGLKFAGIGYELS